MPKKLVQNTDPKNQFRRAIGERLKAAREGQKKEIREVARGCNMKVKALERIEAGQSNFRMLTIDRLCHYYGISRVGIMQAAARDSYRG